MRRIHRFSFFLISYCLLSLLWGCAASSERLAYPELSETVSFDLRTPEEIETFITAMPKVELHMHLDGSLSPETIQKLASDQQYEPLMNKSIEEIADLAVVSTSRRTLAEVLEVFRTVYPLLHSEEALEEISYEYMKSAHRQKVIYAEVRFAPALQATAEFPMGEVVESVVKGLKRGEHDFGIQWGIIICLLRHMTIEQNEEMLEAALKYKEHGVVGIDLAGDETLFPLTRFRGRFARARLEGLFTTVHAGEASGSRDLETALEIGVDRVGHATLVREDPLLFQEFVERRIPIEVNLTSNLRTGAVSSYSEHPAREWFAAGVPISVSTDDPGVFDIDLPHEYRIMVNQLGFTPDDLVSVQLSSIECAFLTPEKKAALRDRFLTEIKELRKKLQLH